MIITDPKKLSLPQQVQKNKEDIEDIRNIIDGLDVEDNVVVVNNISQILTAEELEAIKQPVAFIVYNNHLYLKGKATSTTAYFDIVFSITFSTAITFESSEIQVQLSNGALSIVNNTVSTYSATQIDIQLGLKADKTYVDSNFAKLSGANFTGEITSPSIVETMSGYSFLKADSNAERLINYIYAGICKNGNKLTFVINAETTRLASITSDNIVLGRFVVPVSVGNLLFPSTTIGLSNVLKLGRIYAGSSFYQGIEIPYVIYKTSSNTIEVRLYSPNSSMDLNTLYNLRLEATFLLNDNLAS